jgi:hypothetical protein
MLFPSNIIKGDTDDFHAFTVRYKSDEDTKLSLHRDTSIGTLNVNLNNPEDKFKNSDLVFLDPKEFDLLKKKHLQVNFQ